MPSYAVLLLALSAFIVSIPAIGANPVDPSGDRGRAAPPVAGTPEEEPLALAADDRERLARGEILVLKVLPPGGDGKPDRGGTAMAVVHAPADAVWRVLVDYAGHRGLLPKVVNAAVLERDAHHALVRYVIGVGPFSFGFHVNNYPDPVRRRLEFRLAHERANDLFRDSWGYWQADHLPEGTMLTYSMAARTVLPAFLTRGVERAGLVETVKAVRARAEGA